MSQSYPQSPFIRFSQSIYTECYQLTSYKSQSSGGNMARKITTHPDNHADQHSLHHPLRRSEARHIRFAQTRAGVPAGALPGKFRAIHLRYHWRSTGRDAGAGRRRPLLQPRGDPDHFEDGIRQRVPARAGRQGRHTFHSCGVVRDPQIPHPRRHHPVGQPQSGRTGRRFRHQVQHCQRRPRPGEDHRGDLRGEQKDRALSHRGCSRCRAGQGG